MIMAEKNKKRKINIKVLIPTSGLGQRLGDITKYTNKALVRVGKKPAISYIVEAYPKNTNYVVTLGYYGNQVKDFLELTYPERKFTFVTVDKYEGEGSSIGYSILQAKPFIQCPFIYHACDTIVEGPIPAPQYNWNGGYKGMNASFYGSFKVISDSNIQPINDRGALDFDYLHIGILGVKDFKQFWKTLEQLYKKDPENSALNDCQIINEMLKLNKVFKVHEFKSWFDVGSVEGLNHARKEITDKLVNMDKIDQAVYIFDKFVIKFFFDESLVQEKVKRAVILAPLVPEIEGVKNNFYRYKYVKGDLYSRAVTPLDFEKFLDWCKGHLWIALKEVSREKFKMVCQDFYFNKTVQRIQKLMDTYSLKDKADVINEETIPPLMSLINKIDFEWLTKSKQNKIHGDLILENIIRTPDGHKLLDWRQNFGGLLKAGDLYYDLAKLNHNLTVNHDIIDQNLFVIEDKGSHIICDIFRKENLVECQKVLFNFISKEKLDPEKVRVLTALVWLNMSPLHHHPFNLFLYYFGKLNLWRALNRSPIINKG